MKLNRKIVNGSHLGSRHRRQNRQRKEKRERNEHFESSSINQINLHFVRNASPIVNKSRANSSRHLSSIPNRRVVQRLNPIAFFQFEIHKATIQKWLNRLKWTIEHRNSDAFERWSLRMRRAVESPAYKLQFTISLVFRSCFFLLLFCVA